MATGTLNAIGKKYSPSIPLTKFNDIKTVTTVNVASVVGLPISFVAMIAALVLLAMSASGGNSSK